MEWEKVWEGRRLRADALEVRLNSESRRWRLWGIRVRCVRRLDSKNYANQIVTDTNVHLQNKLHNSTARHRDTKLGVGYCRHCIASWEGHETRLGRIDLGDQRLGNATLCRCTHSGPRVQRYRTGRPAGRRRHMGAWVGRHWASMQLPWDWSLLRLHHTVRS